jgi:hypothetical protein
MSSLEPPLEPADREDVLRLLAYAIGFRTDGKARRDPYMAEVDRCIAAEAIYEHMRRAGFVVLRQPPAPTL